MKSVRITFSDSSNDTAVINLDMDDDMLSYWQTVPCDVLAGLGVETLAYNIGVGHAPYVFRRVT